jgi:hypothetical protein
VDGTWIADRQYTIEYHLERSGREALPLERSFVQRRVGNNKPAAGRLSPFVARGRESALEQYLLMHSFASSDEDGLFDVRLPAHTWARAIGGFIDPLTGEVEPAALHAVSRNWRFLKELGLIGVQRSGRRARVWLLADDGSGDPYVHPGAGALGKVLIDGPGYIQLPYAYWLDGWHTRLSLAAKAVLIIAMTLGDGFQLPYGRFPDWYGISASTGERGLRELAANGLLHRERHRRPDTEAKFGYVEVYYNELRPPFGPRGFLARSVHPEYAGPPSPKATTKTKTTPKPKATAKAKAAPKTKKTTATATTHRDARRHGPKRRAAP